MSVKSSNGKSEFVGCCSFHAEQIPKKMIKGEVIVISKMNTTARTLGYNNCDYDIGEPPQKCPNTPDFIVERGFPIQD